VTALVLRGGGSRGAVEVGLYRALVELDILLDFSRTAAPTAQRMRDELNQAQAAWCRVRARCLWG